jgi:hypothetical protein
MKTIKCIFRTLFYSILLLFTICSLLIISNPKRFGITYYAIKQSATNIFFPTTFEEFRPKLVLYSYTKLSRWNDHNIIEIIEDGFMFESWYWCKYRYIDDKGETKVNIDHVIHNWKPWEYYYFEENKNFLTPEHIRADNLRKEWMTKYRDPEIEKYRRYQID